MRIDIISVVPDLLKSPFDASILKRAIEAKLVEVHIHNLRDYTTDNYKSVDDYQFGGGAGMVMTIEPIDKCISKLKSERDYDEVIYMTPDGDVLNQSIANQLGPGCGAGPENPRFGRKGNAGSFGNTRLKRRGFLQLLLDRPGQKPLFGGDQFGQ